MQTLHHATLRLLGAVIKYEVDQNYTRESGQFTNSGSDPVQLQPGTIFTGGDTPSVYDEGSPAAFTGICVTTVEVQPGATVPVAWVEQGPAIVNINEVDLPSDPGQVTTLKAAMAAASLKLVEGLDT